MLRPGLTLYFVRHGQTDWNAAQRYQGQTDIPLNETGRGQAALCGGILKAALGDQLGDLDYIASPLSRATETMEILRREIGFDAKGYRTDERLKEQHFGHWEGIVYQDLKTLDPEGLAARKADIWGWVPRGGENYQMVTDRVAGVLGEIRRDTVITSHGNVGRALRGILLRLPKHEVPKLDAPQDKVLCLQNGTMRWL
jgi:broad specificity phosphatase PhoE